MKKWIIKILTKIYSRFTIWLMKGNAINIIFTEDKRYIVLMNEEKFKEWEDFENNVFIVYENEQQLKMDFPNAIQCTGKDCNDYGHICE